MTTVICVVAIMIPTAIEVAPFCSACKSSCMLILAIAYHDLTSPGKNGVIREYAMLHAV